MKFKLSENAIQSVDIKLQNNLQKPKSVIIDDILQQELLLQVKEIQKNIEQVQDKTQKSILFYEIGLIYKDKIGDLRNAMINFQKSYEADDTFLPNLKIVREVFIQKENWDFVLNIIDTEIQFVTEINEKNHLFALKAEILSVYKNDFNSSEEILLKLFENNKESFFVLRKLKAFYFNQKKYKKYFALALETLKLKINDDYKQAVLIDLITLIYQKKVFDSNIASYITELFKLENSFSLNLQELNWKKIADEIEDKLSKKDTDEIINPEDIYILFKICEDYLKDIARANKILINNYQHIQNHYLLLNEFEKHYQENNNWEKLITIKKKKIEILDNNNEKSNIYYEMGIISFEKLKDIPSAKQYYTKSLELNYDNLLAIKELGKIYYISNDIENLIKYHILEATKTNNNYLRTIQYFKIAQIYQFQLDNSIDAESYYLKSLDFTPNYLPSIQGLLQIYSSVKNWEGYIKILLLQLEIVKDENLIFSIKFKIAEIYFNQLNNIDRSYDFFMDLFDKFPYNSQVVEYLEEILAIKSKWEELIILYTEILKQISEPFKVVDIYSNISDILSKKMGNNNEAVIYLKKILEVIPDYLPAIQKLSAIYKKENMWNDLIKINLNEIDFIDSPVKKGLLYFEIGKIFEKELNNKQEALKYYENSSEYLLTSEIIAKLDYFYTEFKQFDKLIDLFENNIKNTTNLSIKSDYKIKIGQIYLYELNKFDKALNSIEDAYYYDPSRKAAFLLLKSLYLKGGLVQKVLKLFEAFKAHVDSDDLPDFLFENAQIHYFYLSNFENAENYIFEAMKLKKEKKYYDFLIRIYFESESFNKVLLIKDEYSEFLTKEEKIPFLQYIVSYTEQNPKHQYIPIKEYVEIFNITPNNYIFYKLLDILLKNGLWNDLIELIDMKLYYSTDINEQIDLQYQLAQIYEYYLKDYKQALYYYNQALLLNNNHFISLQGQKRIYKKTGNVTEIIATFQKESQLNINPEIKSENNYQNAIILINQFKKTDEGIEILRNILKTNPSHDKSFKLLFDIYSERNNNEELLNIINLKIDTTKDFSQKEKLLIRKSEILIRNFNNNPELIIKTLQELLTINPQNSFAFINLINGYLLKKDFPNVLKLAHNLSNYSFNSKEKLQINYILFKTYNITNDLKNCFKVGLELFEKDLLNYNEVIVLYNAMKSENETDNIIKVLEKIIKHATDKDKVGYIIEYLNVIKEDYSENDFIEKLNYWYSQIKSSDLLFYYINHLENKHKIKEAIKIIEENLAKINNPSILAKFTKKLGDLYYKSNDITKALLSFTKAYELLPTDKTIIETLISLYLSNPNYYSNIIKFYPDLIKRDISYLSLVEDLLIVYKNIKKPTNVYRIATMISFLKIKNDLATLIHKNSFVTEPTNNYNIYENNKPLYLFHNSDRYELRRTVWATFDGIGKIFKKTLSDYNFKAEKITQKSNQPIFELFNSVKNKFYSENIDLYVKNDGTYQIDFIFPDNLAIIIPDKFLALNKKEFSFFIGQYLDRLNSFEFLTLYYSNEEIINYIKAVINFVIEEDIFTDQQVLDYKKLLNKGISSNSKRNLLNLKNIVSYTNWKEVDFEKYIQSAHITSIRTGLVMSGDINFAAKALLKTMTNDQKFLNYNEIIEYANSFDDFKELLLFAIDEKYPILEEMTGLKFNIKIPEEI